MGRVKWARQLFQSIDQQDVEAFLAFLTDDVLFRFGNTDPASGKASVGEAVSGFFGSINGLSHDLAEVWDEEDAVICQGSVTYTRHDKTTLTVPFVNILKLDADLIKEYLIYIDISGLYGPAYQGN